MKGILAIESMVFLLAILAFATLFLQIINKVGLETISNASELEKRFFRDETHGKMEFLLIIFSNGNNSQKNYLPYHQSKITADSRSMK